MKKLLLALLLALLSFFMFLGISQAGQCIYLYSYEGRNYYYDSSDVKYSGDTVSFYLYKDKCASSGEWWDLEIDCARRMIREYDFFTVEPTDWKPIAPGSYDDTLRIKLCR